MVSVNTYHGGLNKPGETTKTTTPTRSIAFLARKILQTIGEKYKDVLRKGYPSGNQYLSFPDTQKGRK